MDTNKAIRFVIMSQEKIRERMLNIARGVYKPEPNEPKIWFTSMRSLAEVLSDENRALLHIIKDTKPNSIKELSEVTGRKPSNLSRTLKTLSNYGIVELVKESKQVKPIVNTVSFEILAA
jgi:predicted transcriptional regulator